jgi:integrase/recombinase XerD
MGQLLDEFLEWMRIGNASEYTLYHRRACIRRFIEWATERGLDDPMEVTRPILQSYQRWMYYYRQKNGQPLTFRTQYSRLVPVRSWFRWLVRNHHILYNPASDLDMPRIEKRLPRAVLSEPEAETVLMQPDISDPLGLRDRAVLETLYSTGIRRTELANLKLYNLDRERGTLSIWQGKGKKDRIVPIGERAVLWIQKYLDQSRPHLVIEPDEGVLFLTVEGSAFNPDSLSTLVREYVERANLGKRGACHMFRHTMATLMLEGGADIRFIQQMLGHSDLQSTQVYTQVSIRQLKQIHTATHPGATLEKHQAAGIEQSEQEQLETDLLVALEQEASEEEDE